MPSSRPRPAKTVLIAEDDRMVRELIVTRLGAEGYSLVEAAAGDQALPLLQGGDIDVLVTDISMPGKLDGWALAEQARAIHPRVAVVYVSGGPPEAARQVSGSVFLRKPFPAHAIVHAIGQVTAQPDDEPA